MDKFSPKQFRYRSVFVVGQCFYKDGHSSGSVAFVRELLVAHSFQLSCPLQYGSLDVVGGHIDGFGIGDGLPQTWIGVRISSSHLGGHRQFTDEFGENLAAFRVGCRFFMLDGSPF